MRLYGFSGLGRFAVWRQSFYAGALVLTKSRIYGNSHCSVVLDIPLADEPMRKIEVSVDEEGRLDVTFEASDFIPAKGWIRLRFKTPQAHLFLDALQPFLKQPEKTQSA